jgi:hypothetical protein
MYATGEEIVAFAPILFSEASIQESCRQDGTLSLGEKVVKVYPKPFHEDEPVASASAASSAAPSSSTPKRDKAGLSDETMRLFAAAMKARAGQHKK